MTTAVVDAPEMEEGLAQAFLDTLVLQHPSAPETETPVLEMALPVGSALPLHEVVRPNRRPGRRLEARWVPDSPREQALICIWVPRTGADASEPSPQS
jgi:hypothetical protein